MTLYGLGARKLHPLPTRDRDAACTQCGYTPTAGWRGYRVDHMGVPLAPGDGVCGEQEAQP